MKKIRILLGLMAVVMLFPLMAVNVFATDSSKVVLSDVPFDYMTNMQTRPFDSYDNLSTPNKKLVYSIPDGVAETLTTEALLETILDNKYIIDLFAYDDFVKAVKSREEQFRIVEFLEREDSIEVLNTNIGKYEKKVSENYSADVNRQLRLMKKIKDNAYYILNDVDRPLSRAAVNGYVYTKGGVRVNCILNATWSDSEVSQEEAQEDYNDYLNTYDITAVSGVTPRYNCHSYAWHNSNVNTNNAWIEGEDEIQKYISESTQNTNTPQIGYTKVVYYERFTGDISHLAKVYGVYSNGTIASVISKWGVNGLFIHEIEECPYYYPIIGASIETFNY